MIAPAPPIMHLNVTVVSTQQSVSSTRSFQDGFCSMLNKTLFEHDFDSEFELDVA